MTLLKKDRQIKESFVYGGYLILKKLKRSKENKLSFYEVSQELTKEGIIHYRQQFFCLMFLYSCGVIDFKEPYVELSHAD
jgi:hypothetical protein